MAEIKDKPKDLPTANALDDIEVDPDTGLSIDRYLAFGTTPRALPNPPRDGDVVVYKVKVECVGQAHKRRTDGEVRYRSELEILSVARVDEDLPPDYESDAARKKREKKEADEAEAQAKAEAAENQPPLMDETGAPWGDGYPEPHGDDEDAPANPEFSSAKA